MISIWGSACLAYLGISLGVSRPSSGVALLDVLTSNGFGVSEVSVIDSWLFTLDFLPRSLEVPDLEFDRSLVVRSMHACAFYLI